jgi:integrase
VKQAVAHAVASGYLPANPLSSVRLPAAGRRELVLNEAGFARLLSLAPTQEPRDLLTFCWETGCRPGDALGMDVEHLAPDRLSASLPLAKSKGGRDRRVVLFTTAAAVELVARLADGRKSGPLLRDASGGAWSGPSVQNFFRHARHVEGWAALKASGWRPPEAEALMFAEQRGWSLNKAKQAMREREARRMAPRLCLYVLRHSWATRALKASVGGLRRMALNGTSPASIPPSSVRRRRASSRA